MQGLTDSLCILYASREVVLVRPHTLHYTQGISVCCQLKGGCPFLPSGKTPLHPLVILVRFAPSKLLSRKLGWKPEISMTQSSTVLSTRWNLLIAKIKWRIFLQYYPITAFPTTRFVSFWLASIHVLVSKTASKVSNSRLFTKVIKSGFCFEFVTSIARIKAFGKKTERMKQWNCKRVLQWPWLVINQSRKWTQRF